MLVDRVALFGTPGYPISMLKMVLVPPYDCAPQPIFTLPMKLLEGMAVRDVTVEYFYSHTERGIPHYFTRAALRLSPPRASHSV